MDTYLQIKQAAALLGVSRQSVHAWINAGRLTTSTIAGRRVIQHDHKFDALAARQRARQ
jgi:excisionase family DNA binding protein